MVALATYRADQCPGCGGQLTETTTPESEHRIVADLPHRCHRCTALAVKQAEYKDAPHPQALLFTTHNR